MGFPAWNGAFPWLKLLLEGLITCCLRRFNMKDITASKFAYAAVVFLVAGMALIIMATNLGINLVGSYEGTPPSSVVLFMLIGLLYHLTLLPVIAALPAPAWARASGYTWIIVENILVMLVYYGAVGEIGEALRMGLFVALATWIYGASTVQQGAFRWVGLLVVLALAGAALISPFVDATGGFQPSTPSMLLLIAWLIMAGRQLGLSHADAAPAALMES
jgi:hypothetical protein